MGQARRPQINGKKQASVTYNMDQDDEVSKKHIFIVPELMGSGMISIYTTTSNF